MKYMKSLQLSEGAPRTYLDNEDIRCVASPYPTASSTVTSPVVSAEVKVVLLERLEKEIATKIGGSMCRRNVTKRKLGGKKRARGDAAGAKKNEATDGSEKEVDAPPMSVAESAVRSRSVIGINQCTRILEQSLQQQKGESKSSPKPSLIILARDVRPATVLAHISLYANLLSIPTLILPGMASLELGRALGIRSVASLVFLSSSNCDEYDAIVKGDDDREREWKNAHNDVDSFVNYVMSKIPNY